MTKTDILKQLNREYTVKRELAENNAIFNKKRAEKNEDFRYLETEINTLIIEIAKQEFASIDATENRKLLNDLRDKAGKMLKKIGLNLKSLEMQFICKKCDDTGFIDGKPCECFIKELNNKLLKASNIDLSNLRDFSKCDLSIFSNEELENTKKRFKLIKEFCDKFPNTSKKNIVLTGGTGTGKTFMTECVAAELIKKGFFVYYTTAFNLNNQMVKCHVSKIEEKEMYLSPLLESDCLIIDDLGQESILRNVTIEYLLTIISERGISGKSTIISTNLSLNDILDRYGERVFSRLSDKRTNVVLQMTGEDLRLKKR